MPEELPHGDARKIGDGEIEQFHLNGPIREAKPEPVARKPTESIIPQPDANARMGRGAKCMKVVFLLDRTCGITERAGSL